MTFGIAYALAAVDAAPFTDQDQVLEDAYKAAGRVGTLGRGRLRRAHGERGRVRVHAALEPLDGGPPRRGDEWPRELADAYVRLSNVAGA